MLACYTCLLGIQTQVSITVHRVLHQSSHLCSLPEGSLQLVDFKPRLLKTALRYQYDMKSIGGGIGLARHVDKSQTECRLRNTERKARQIIPGELGSLNAQLRSDYVHHAGVAYVSQHLRTGASLQWLLNGLPTSIQPSAPLHTTILPESHLVLTCPCPGLCVIQGPPPLTSTLPDWEDEFSPRTLKC